MQDGHEWYLCHKEELPSEEDIKLIEYNPEDIQKIEHLSDLLLLFAIDKDPSVIRFINSSKISFQVFERLMDLDQDNIHLIHLPTPAMINYWTKRFYDNSAYEVAFSRFVDLLNEKERL